MPGPKQGEPGKGSLHRNYSDFDLSVFFFGLIIDEFPFGFHYNIVNAKPVSGDEEGGFFGPVQGKLHVVFVGADLIGKAGDLQALDVFVLEQLQELAQFLHLFNIHFLFVEAEEYSVMEFPKHLFSAGRNVGGIYRLRALGFRKFENGFE